MYVRTEQRNKRERKRKQGRPAKGINIRRKEEKEGKKEGREKKKGRRRRRFDILS